MRILWINNDGTGFALKDACRNAFWPEKDRLLLRDTMGGLCEIHPHSWP